MLGHYFIVLNIDLYERIPVKTKNVEETPLQPFRRSFRTRTPPHALISIIEYRNDIEYVLDKRCIFLNNF